MHKGPHPRRRLPSGDPTDERIHYGKVVVTTALVLSSTPIHGSITPKLFHPKRIFRKHSSPLPHRPPSSFHPSLRGASVSPRALCAQRYIHSPYRCTNPFCFKSAHCAGLDSLHIHSNSSKINTAIAKLFFKHYSLLHRNIFSDPSVFHSFQFYYSS